MNRSAITVIAATPLEASAVRRACPGMRVVEAGVALAQLGNVELGETVISCGLAGGLRRDLPSGTVVIPRTIRRPTGEVFSCDVRLAHALERAARSLGIEPVLDPLLTSDRIINGAARSEWAARGYAGVDMETGRVAAPRLAAVRVILDTPHRELSSDWVHPRRAMLKPWNWPQALWLVRAAPRAAQLAARIIAAAGFSTS